MSIQSRKLRILWHSVSPHIRGGYGICTRHICFLLKNAGFDLIISAYYGIQHPGIVKMNKVPVLPATRGSYGSKSFLYYYQTLKADCGVLLSDPWAFSWFPKEVPYSISYGPLDSVNYVEEMKEIMSLYTQRIAPSKFQVKEWKKYGIDFKYIPHGVDTSTFKPISKKKARKIQKFSEDDFIIGQVSANSDIEPRKAYPQIFKAIKLFLDQHPDVHNLKYFHHGNPLNPSGVQLPLFAKKYGIDNITIFEDPILSECGLNDDEMNILYNAFDILINPSFREGFGLPIIEAAATGLTSIVSNFSSMPELVKGHGWICNTISSKLNLIDTPIGASSSIPDVYSLSKCLEEAYFKVNLRKKYEKRARKFSLKFDWNHLVKNKWIPFFEEVERELSEKKSKVKRFKKITFLQ